MRQLAGHNNATRGRNLAGHNVGTVEAAVTQTAAAVLDPVNADGTPTVSSLGSYTDVATSTALTGALVDWSVNGDLTGSATAPDVEFGDVVQAVIEVTPTVGPALLFRTNAVTVSAGVNPNLTNVATQGSVAFNFDGAARDVGNSFDGSAYVVADPNGTVQFTSVTPAIGDEGGSLINGVMVNPRYHSTDDTDGSSDLAFDERSPNFDATKVAAFPVTLSVGDCIVKAISEPGVTNPRRGYLQEYAVCWVVASAPAANEIAPAPFTWPGRGAPVWRTFDRDAVLNALTLYDMEAFDKPVAADFDQLFARLDRFNIGILASDGASGSTGYQAFCLHDYGSADTAATNTNYSEVVVFMYNYMMLQMIDQATPSARRNAIVDRIGVLGSWYFDILEGRGNGKDGDGAQRQHMTAVTPIGLLATGRSNRVSDIVTVAPDNPFSQSFIWTQALKDRLAPHQNAVDPCLSYERIVLAVDTATNTVTVEAELPGDPFHLVALNMDMHLADGTLIGRGTSNSSSSGATAWPVPLDRMDNPVNVGDRITLRSPYEIVVGTADWTLQSIVDFNSFVGAPTRRYFTQQSWTMAILIANMLGFEDEFEVPTRLVQRTALPDYPAGFDWLHFHGKTYLGGSRRTMVDDFYNAHAATILPPLVEPGVTQPAAATEPPMDGYVFDVGHGNPATGNMILRGVGTTGDTIDVYGEATQGGTDTNVFSTTVDATGAWEVQVPVSQANWGDWYRPRWRANGGTFAATTNLVGLGHVIMPFGQSELAYFMKPSSFYQQTPKTHLPFENVSLLIDDADDGSNITGLRVTQANYQTAGGAASMTTGLLSAMCAISAAVPNRKYCWVDAVDPGSSFFKLVDDSSTAGSGERDWGPLQAIVDRVRSGGSDIGLVIMNWVNSTAASLPNMLENWAPGVFGQLASGAPWAVGEANAEGTGTYNVDPIDHTLWDITTADPADLGRGLFSRARTKLHINGPLPFADTGTTEDFAYDNSLRVARAAREGIETFVADARVQTFLQGYGPSTHISDFGGGIHPVVDDAWGIPQFAQMCLVTPTLELAGYAVNGEPVLTGATINTAGDAITIPVSNKGSGMTTGRKAGALPRPDPDMPHGQPVIGVELIIDGTRHPIWNAAAVASDPVLYDPMWQGVVDFNAAGDIEVQLANALASTNVVEVVFLEGQASALLLEDRDVIASAYLDLPYATDTALVDASADHPYTGQPVKPQPPSGTLTLDMTAVVGAPAFTPGWYAMDGETWLTRGGNLSGIPATPAGVIMAQTIEFKAADMAADRDLLITIGTGDLLYHRKQTSERVDVRTYDAANALTWRITTSASFPVAVDTPYLMLYSCQPGGIGATYAIINIDTGAVLTSGTDTDTGSLLGSGITDWIIGAASATGTRRGTWHMERTQVIIANGVDVTDPVVQSAFIDGTTLQSPSAAVSAFGPSIVDIAGSDLQTGFNAGSGGNFTQQGTGTITPVP